MYSAREFLDPSWMTACGVAIVLEVNVRTMNTMTAKVATLFSAFLSSFPALILVASLLSNFKQSSLASISG
jgi:hypothetical protein